MKVKRITRALSLFLVCVMLASILPLGAYAEYYSDTYRVPKAYIKDLKITTDMAEVCQTGNLARSVEAQLEGVIEDKNGGPFPLRLGRKCRSRFLALSLGAKSIRTARYKRN